MKVYDPKTKKWVQPNGRIGRKILAEGAAKKASSRGGGFVSKSQMDMCYKMKKAAEELKLEPTWDCDKWRANTNVSNLPQRVKDLNPVLYRMSGNVPIYIGPLGGTYFLKKIDGKKRKIYIKLN